MPRPHPFLIRPIDDGKRLAPVRRSRCELACALDRREHAQAAIEPPATWDAIEMTPDDEPPGLPTGQNHPDVPGLVAVGRRPGQASTGALEDSFPLARPDVRPRNASPATPRVEFA